jgi:methyl-accepting chemotaxis protein
VSLVEETGNALNAILESNQDIANKVSSITEATREQAMGVSDVTKVVSELDRITQSNATMADQSASRANGLDSSASDLKEIVAFFKFHADTADQKAA